FDVRSVWAVKGEGYGWRERFAHVGELLCVEDDNGLGAIAQVSVKVPPFISAFAAVCAKTIFPRLNMFFLHAQELVLLHARCQMRRHYLHNSYFGRWSRRSRPKCCQKTLL